MVNTTFVSSFVKDVDAMLTAIDTIARSTVRSSRKQTPFSSKQETNVSWKEFQAMQPNLYPSQEDQVLLKVTNWPGISGLAGVLGKKLIHFVQI